MSNSQRLLTYNFVKNAHTGNEVCEGKASAKWLISYFSLQGASLHLDLLLSLRGVGVLVAHAGSHRHHGTAAMDQVQEVPRVLWDLTRISAWGREDMGPRCCSGKKTNHGLKKQKNTVTLLECDVAVFAYSYLRVVDRSRRIWKKKKEKKVYSHLN